MADNNSFKTMEDHISWFDSVSERLDMIYKQLTQYQEDAKNQPDSEKDTSDFMELFNHICSISVMTKSLQVKDDELKTKQETIQDQVDILQKTLNSIHFDSTEDIANKNDTMTE